MNLFPCQGQASKSLKDPGPLNKTGYGAHFDVTASTEQGPRRHSWEMSCQCRHWSPGRVRRHKNTPSIPLQARHPQAEGPELPTRRCEGSSNCFLNFQITSRLQKSWQPFTNDCGIKESKGLWCAAESAAFRPCNAASGRPGAGARWTACLGPVPDES